MPAAAQNHLIERLPRRDRARLLHLAEDVPMVLGQVLCEPGQPARHVWFPVDGFVSLVAPIDGKPALEVGMVGREGMLGAQLILGVAAVRLQALVQGSGSAWRIGRAAFRAELASPVVTYNLPSRPNASAPPLWKMPEAMPDTSTRSLPGSATPESLDRVVKRLTLLRSVCASV